MLLHGSILILAALGIFGFTFLCYLIAIRVALRVREGTRLMVAILLASVLIRAVSLFSWPMITRDMISDFIFTLCS